MVMTELSCDNEDKYAHVLSSCDLSTPMWENALCEKLSWVITSTKGARIQEWVLKHFYRKWLICSDDKFIVLFEEISRFITEKAAEEKT